MTRRLAASVAAVALLGAGAIGCRSFPAVEERTLGRVVETRTEYATRDRVRVVATIESETGDRWEVRLDADTRCAPSPATPPPTTALYPDCTRLGPT